MPVKRAWLSVKEVDGLKIVQGIPYYHIEFENYKRKQWIPNFDLTYEARIYFHERLKTQNKLRRQERYENRCLIFGRDLDDVCLPSPFKEKSLNVTSPR